MKIKICGQTRLEDIRYSFERGADLCGVVIDVPSSPRSVSIGNAEPLFKEFPGKIVALTADADASFLKEIALKLKPAAIQLTAGEKPEEVKKLSSMLDIPIWKSLHLPQKAEDRTRQADETLEQIDLYTGAGCSAFVLDTRVPDIYGGSGVKSDWDLAGEILSRTGTDTFLAGGIDPQNVIEAAGLNPYGIDLASGVEISPGEKSREKIDSLFKALGSSVR